MARSIGVTFDNKHIIHPSAHARVNADALNTINTGTSRNIVFLGTSTSGAPGKIHWFSNPADAREVLRGGDLLQAGELAWNPSGDGSGAGMIGFIRTQPATQAQLVKDAMTIKSKEYGSHTNKIQVKMEDGTITGTKTITVYRWTDEVREIYEDLGIIFNIQYKGEEEYAVLTITQTDGKATNLSVKVGEDSETATEVLSYPLGEGEYYDINKLINDINEHEDFEASISPVGNKNLTTDLLDAVENKNIKTKYSVLALKGDILHQTRTSRLIEISFTSGSFPSNFDFTYLAGAVDGAVPSSWSNYFEMLHGEAVYLIVPLTADKSIHMECNRFINNQAEQERNFMLGVYGGNEDETIDQAIGRSLSLSSSRAILAYPGIKIQQANDTVTTLPAYMTAALIAGKIAGKAVGDPITLDPVNIAGLSKVLKTADIDRLLQGGVTTLEFVRHGNIANYRIAQGITCWHIDSNPSYREISMRTITDNLSSELIGIMERKFAGTKGTINTVALMKNEVQSFLDRKRREDIIVEYLPESVTVQLDGEVARINYACIPVGAINYILITTTYYQQAITAS